MNDDQRRVGRVFIICGLVAWSGCHASVAFAVNLATPQGYPANASRIVAADFNHDNKADVATAATASGVVKILLNAGNGSFTSGASYTLPSNLRAITAGDMNGDSHIDLITIRSGVYPSGDGVVTVLLGNGDGTFAQPAHDYPVLVAADPANQLTPYSIVAADLDGDLDLDIAAAAVVLNETDRPGYFSIMKNLGNNPTGEPILAQSVNIGSKEALTWHIAADDLDNDNDIDLVVSNRVDNSITVFLNSGNGIEGDVRKRSIGDIDDPTAGPGVVATGDVNGDGFVDLVTINGSHTYSVMTNNGGADPLKAGRFNLQGQYPVGSQVQPATDLPLGGALADLDGDLKLDLIVGLTGTGGTGALAVHPGIGDGTFGPAQRVGEGLDLTLVVTQDLDGDNDADIIAADFSESAMVVFLNQTTAP